MHTKPCPAATTPVAPVADQARLSQHAQRFNEHAHALIGRLEAWAHQGAVRSLAVKVLVSILGPLVVVVGIAMTVLPGPGLVVIALGLALLALEYEWARGALGLMGRTLARAKEATVPSDGSKLRHAIGMAAAGTFFVATFALTTAFTTFLGAHAIL